MVEVKLVTTAAQPAAAIRESVNVRDIPQAMGRMFEELAGYMQAGKARMVGPPFAYYHSWSEDSTDMSVGFPTAGPVAEEGRVAPFTLPSVRAATAVHVGPYPRLMETYAAMERWVHAQGLETDGYMWEVYLNEPGKVPDAELMTEIYWPIKEER